MEEMLRELSLEQLKEIWNRHWKSLRELEQMHKILKSEGQIMAEMNMAYKSNIGEIIQNGKNQIDWANSEAFKWREEDSTPKTVTFLSNIFKKKPQQKNAFWDNLVQLD